MDLVTNRKDRGKGEKGGENRRGAERSGEAERRREGGACSLLFVLDSTEHSKYPMLSTATLATKTLSINKSPGMETSAKTCHNNVLSLSRLPSKTTQTMTRVEYPNDKRA